MIQDAHIPECPRTLDGSSPYLTMYRTQPIVFIFYSVIPIWLQLVERVVKSYPCLARAGSSRSCDSGGLVSFVVEACSVLTLICMSAVVNIGAVRHKGDWHAGGLQHRYMEAHGAVSTSDPLCQSSCWL